MRLPFLRTKALAPATGIKADGPPTPRIPSWATPLASSTGDYAGQVRAAFLANPVAARAIRTITESAGGAPIVSDPPGHPALALLRSCGFGASGPGLLETLAGHLLLHGNAYVEVACSADGLPAALFALRPERVSVEAILVRAVGVGDGGSHALAATVGGTAIRPLAPVHLRWERIGGQLMFRWIPQSRAGFGWPDLIDVPLAESTAAWRVILRDGSGMVASADVATPEWSTLDRPGPLWLDVAQIGLTLGRPATLTVA